MDEKVVCWELVFTAFLKDLAYSEDLVRQQRRLDNSL